MVANAALIALAPQMAERIAELEAENHRLGNWINAIEEQAGDLQAEVDMIFRQVDERDGAISVLRAQNEAYRSEISAAIGYMLNAMIDLQTGTKKATTIGTLEGGINRMRTALSPERQV
jgi:uncharacterized protein YhaN